MKKKLVSIILVVVLCLSLCGVLSGCEDQKTLEFYVGNQLARQYKVDNLGSINGYDPMLKGYVLLDWFESKDSQVPFDDQKTIYKDSMLFGKFLNVFTGEQTFNPTPMTEVEVLRTQAKYEDIGEVIGAYQSVDGYYVVVNSFYGYHMEDNPTITVGVAISSQGQVKRVEILGHEGQTEGFTEMIAQDYLDKVYADKPAVTTLEVEPVTGATISSNGVKRGIWTASNFVQKAFGVVADTSAENIAILNEMTGASFENITTDYVVDETLGTLLYVGKANMDGNDVVGIVVKSSLSYNATGGADTPWESPIPNSATIAMVVDKGTDKIVAINVIDDGAKDKEYFGVPQDRIDSYKTVAITSEDVFDGFDGGLVKAMGYETEIKDDFSVITGTTLMYTGATENGTFTSQFVRNAFKAGARVYTNCK